MSRATTRQATAMILDAPLIDRVAQPAFDRLYHATGIPVTLVAQEAWAFTMIGTLVEQALAISHGAPLQPAATVLLLLVTGVIWLLFDRARKRHRAWLAAPETMAGTVPAAYLAQATVRVLLAVLIVLSATHEIADIVAGHLVAQRIMGLLVDTATILGLYADACRTLPPSARQTQGHAQPVANPA